jgi:hypothetical protein
LFAVVCGLLCHEGGYFQSGWHVTECLIAVTTLGNVLSPGSMFFQARPWLL